MHTESTYSQQSCNNKSKYSSTVTIHKQKRCPTKTDTRQHLRQFYFKKTGATHSHLHKAQRKKRKWSLPWFASSHFGDRSLKSLRRGAPTSSCRASLAPYARQFGRGFWGNRSSCIAISVRTGSGYGRRSAPSDPREDTLSFRTTTDNRDHRDNPDLSLSETKRPSLTP